ncbi:MAG: single-stranded-DNA-specific exonuclease RecJ [Firmicutes bacterium]|nr:single-stranded-DNA-specific exonuclease RecJ [Bacillota bacterium]
MDKKFYDEAHIKMWASELSVEEKIARLLLSRGFKTPNEAFSFLHPNAKDLSSPLSLAGVKEAVEQIRKHIQNKNNILIFGDYDCDGVGASMILYRTLKHLGASVFCFIPSRTEDGYGLTNESLLKAKEQFNPKLIITVDCGICSVSEVDFIKGLGIEIIITDHHEPSETLPDCICVNPKIGQSECSGEGNSALAGAGVAFKIAEALTSWKFVSGMLDMLAVSTIADLVPLTGDNRIYARLGIDMLNNNLSPQFRALLEVAKFDFSKPVDSYDIAFKIAPRLNASGRLSHAEKSLRLLISDNEREIRGLASELEEENKERQELCQKTASEAKELLKNYDLINKKIIALYDENWEGGVVGISASRIAQEFNKPTILFAPASRGSAVAEGEFRIKGSARSAGGVNIYSVLSACKDTLITFGGHPQAAGVTLDLARLNEFINTADEYICKTFKNSDFLPKNICDMPLSIEEATVKFASELSMFEPYGNKNPKPNFSTEIGGLPFAKMSEYSPHLRYKPNENTSVVAFSAVEYLPVLKSAVLKKMFYSLKKETYRNKESATCIFGALEVLSFNPNEEGLIKNYERLSIPREPLIKSGKVFKHNETFGHLIIAFKSDTFHMLSLKFPSYRKEFALLPSENPVNTILLSPINSKVSFAYYSKIEVYDNPPKEYISYLNNSYNCDIIIPPDINGR